MPQLQIQVLKTDRHFIHYFTYSEFGEGRPSSRPPSSLESTASRFDVGPSLSAVGGLSVTGCLADFSVYIFHPYGGGKKSGKQPYKD
jgi:hypothetical protein